jgi:Ca-activated chloride channel homolog
MRYLQVLCGLLLCCAAAGFGLAQDGEKNKDKNKKPVPPLEIKANVTVLDAAGKYSDDIKIEDIKIFEDGIEQKITYFVKKKPTLNLGLIFDNSGSMRKSLDIMVEMPSVFTSKLTAQDEAFVVRFVSSENIEVIQDWTSNGKLLNEALSNMYVEGGQSAVLDAVYLGAEKVSEREKQEKSERSAIILISDGEERDSFYALKDLEKMFAGTDLQVFVISFAESAPQNKKKARFVSNVLTLKTGGTTYTLPKKFTLDDIANTFERILLELRSPYIIGYTSTNPSRDGIARKLAIQIADGANGAKREGIVRESFIVPKD